jgi:hypothetical protein
MLVQLLKLLRLNLSYQLSFRFNFVPDTLANSTVYLKLARFRLFWKLVLIG